jgi:hypothetical protein
MNNFYNKVDKRDAVSVYNMMTSGISLVLDGITSFNIHFNKILIKIPGINIRFSPIRYKKHDKSSILVYNTNLDSINDLTKYNYQRKLPDGNIEIINLYDFFLMNGFSLFNSIYQELPIYDDLILFQEEFLASFESSEDKKQEKEEEEEYKKILIGKMNKLSKPDTDRTINKPYLTVSIKIPETLKDYDLFMKKIKMMISSGFIYNGEYLNYILLVFDPNIKFIDIDKDVKDIIEYTGQSVGFRFKISESDIYLIKQSFILFLNREIGNYFNVSLSQKENIINLSLKLDSSGNIETFENTKYTRPNGSVIIDTCSVSVNPIYIPNIPNISDTFYTFWHTHPNKCVRYDSVNDIVWDDETSLGGLFSISDIQNYYFNTILVKSPTNFVFSPEGIYSCNISKKFYKIVNLLNYKGQLQGNFITEHKMYEDKYHFLNQMRNIKSIDKFDEYITDLLKNDIFLNQVYYTFYNEMSKTYSKFNDFIKDVNKRCKFINMKVNKYNLSSHDNGKFYLKIPFFKKVWIKEIDKTFNVSSTLNTNIYNITPSIESIESIKDKVLHFYFYDNSDNIVLKTLGKIVDNNKIEHKLLKDTNFEISYKTYKYSFKINGKHIVRPSESLISYEVEGPENLRLKPYLGEIFIYSYQNYDKCIFDILKPVLMKTGDIDHSLGDIYPENSLIFYRILIMFFKNTQTMGKIFKKSTIDSIKMLMEQDDVKKFLMDTYQMNDNDITLLKDDIESIEIIDIHFDKYPEEGNSFISKSFCCVYDYPEIFSKNLLPFSISENNTFTIETYLLPY